ncbi:glycerophosphoryl diester phosphodiesterase [Zunongwangia profunda SM-A87]|uniref:Glycerophosphoryl diester phosphodiesterase n=1 Tax=Zunongwangia profunda (strain DSM 18752 / CCTCC AB 206139 / SM-A87) TaxID=655815 RepID=D5BE76_ZUNPS|nr:glycerophosphodiester phosphodiesterase family protein [Zunongwangia profunda]ADF52835.1 glycerophosphoryl diester phosphodiesterase [Zunongwangia profunda SM-A87]|tara:strand:+ start:427 stop:1257 length:831 start_codon:yes stop_codon:yes gene_type:complete
MINSKSGMLITLFAFFFNAFYFFSFAQGSVEALRPPKNGGTYVIAHRGAHQDVPENTIAAYQKAIEIGCDFVEIDLRKTKDGKFVSIHNEDIDAYFKGKKGKVNSFLFSELREMPLAKKENDTNDYFIPTLEEILKLCKGKIGIYLDLKEADIKGLVQTIKAFKMEKDIVWYIYPKEREAIQELNRYCPECLVMPDPGNERRLKKVLNRIKPKFVASDMGVLTPTFLTTAYSQEVKVFVDDAAANTNEWQKIIDWGVDGIQTNHPQELIDFLNRKK